jgi:hypothetical protein
MNHRLSNNLPFVHVVPARFVGDEPAGFDQNSAASIARLRSRKEFGPKI